MLSPVTSYKRWGQEYVIPDNLENIYLQLGRSSLIMAQLINKISVLNTDQFTKYEQSSKKREFLDKVAKDFRNSEKKFLLQISTSNFELSQPNSPEDQKKLDFYTQIMETYYLKMDFITELIEKNKNVNTVIAVAQTMSRVGRKTVDQLPDIINGIMEVDQIKDVSLIREKLTELTKPLSLDARDLISAFSPIETLKISSDQIIDHDKVPQEVLEELKRNKYPDNLGRIEKINFKDKTAYVSSYLKEYSDRLSDYVDYFIFVDDNQKIISHIELRLVTDGLDAQKPYHKDKPNHGPLYFDKENSTISAEQVLLCLNEYCQDRNHLPLYSDTIMQPVVNSAWEKLTEQGYAKKFQEDIRNRYVML